MARKISNRRYIKKSKRIREKKNFRKEIVEKIETFSKQNKYFTANDVSNELKNDDVDVSRRTVINTLHEMDGKFNFPQKKPLLTIVQIEARLKWCEKWKDYKNWKNVKFTDECTIFMQKKGKRWILNYKNKYDSNVKHNAGNLILVIR
jgi:hypothetical protein